MDSLTSCEVCLEEYTGLRRPMVVCLNGHTFCSSCSEQLATCAQCRQRCLPHKIVNIALLRIVEQNIKALSRDSGQSQTKESEVHPSQQTVSTEEGSGNFDENDEFDSVLRAANLLHWRDEESDTSDEERPRGATGTHQGAAGFLFQEHLMSRHSQHKEEDEDENGILRQAWTEEVLRRSIAEQEERDEEALMCALALSISEQ